MLSIAAALAALAVASIAGLDDAEGADLPWNIDEDTTVRDGTIDVNRSVHIHNGTLLIENMTMTFSADELLTIDVYQSGHLVVRDSTLRFLGQYAGLVIGNDTALEDSQLYFDPSPSSSPSIGHWHGLLSIEGCWIESTGPLLISCQGDLVVNRSSLKVSSGWCLSWKWHSEPVSERNTLLIEDSALISSGSSFNSFGIYLEDHGRWPLEIPVLTPFPVVIRRCTFDGLRPVGLGDGQTPFNLSVLIEGCSGSDLIDGIYVHAGKNATLRDNRWAVRSGIALRVKLSTATGPTVSGGALEGGEFGLSVSSANGTGRLTVEGVSFNGSGVAVDVTGAEVDLAGCALRAVNAEVFANAGAWVHLRGCDHTRRSYASADGEVAELVDVEVLGVAWQNHEAITEGSIRFEPGRDYTESWLDAALPGTVWLPVWMHTAHGGGDVSFVRAFMPVEGLYFWTDFLGPLEAGSRVNLTLIDDFYPEVTVESPRPGSFLRSGTVEMSGSVREVGSGLGSVLARVDGGFWRFVSLVDGARWTVAISDLPDGQHLLEVKAFDHVGLTTVVGVRDVTVDTVAPSIRWSPATGRSCVTPLMLHITTEPHASAWIDGVQWPLTVYGTLTLQVGLVEGDNAFEVLVVDRAGNIARAIVTITLDTVPPSLRLARPGNGSWSRSGTVLVEGETEPGATVEVNGHAAANVDGHFQLPLECTDGTLLVSARAYDPAGNVARAELEVRIDTAPPVVTIDSFVDVYITTAASVTVYGSVAERNLDWVRASWGELSMQGNEWALDVALEEGENPMTVTARDLAGNEVSVVFRLVRDTQGPAVDAALLTDAGRVEAASVGAVCGNASAILVVTLDEDCRLTLKGEWTMETVAGEVERAVTLGPGENVLVLFAIDLLGNHGKNVTLRVVRDVVPPFLEVVEPLGDTWVDTPNYIVQGRTEPGATLIVGGIEAVADATGNFSVEVGLKDGRNEILVVARDRFGNEARRTIWVSHADASPWERMGGEAVPIAAIGASAGLLGVLALLLLLRRSARRARGSGQRPSPRPLTQEEVAAPSTEGRLGSRVRRRD